MLIRRNSEAEASAAKVLAVAEGHCFFLVCFVCSFVRLFVRCVRFVFVLSGFEGMDEGGEEGREEGREGRVEAVGLYSVIRGGMDGWMHVWREVSVLGWWVAEGWVRCWCGCIVAGDLLPRGVARRCMIDCWSRCVFWRFVDG